MNPPQNHDDAGRLMLSSRSLVSTMPKIKLLVEQKGSKTQIQAFFKIYLAHAPTDLTQKATTVVQPAPVYTSQAVRYESWTEKQKNLTSSSNAQQLIATWKSDI